MNELFEAKMAELQEIRELINTGRCHKRELLENLVEEQLFKVHLRISQDGKEQTIEDRIKTWMQQVRKMFGELAEQMADMNTRIAAI